MKGCNCLFSTVYVSCYDQFGENGFRIVVRFVALFLEVHK